MDTQPLPPNPSREPNPSVSLTQTPHHWVNLLVVVLLLINGGLGAYYLILRGNTRIQSTQPLGVVRTVTPQMVDGYRPDFSHQGQNFPPQLKSFTVDNVMNAKVESAYPADSKFNFNSNVYKQDVFLKNGFAKFSYCEEPADPCPASKTKQAAVTVSNVAITKDISLLPLYGGTADGVGVLTFDFSGAGKESYLAAFTVNTYEDRKSVSFSNEKNLGVSADEINDVTIADNGEIKISFKNSSTAPRTFVSVSAGRGSVAFVELTSGKKQKVYDNYNFGYHLNYPKELTVSYGLFMRDTNTETSKKVSPVYFSQDCGLQPTFADHAISFYGEQPDAYGSLNLTVHKIGPATLYLTSAHYGYDPLDWGQIKQKVYIADYVNAIKKGSGVWEREVTLENIHGYSVRHIAPFSQGKPCDTQTREQYQWIAGNLLFNLIFTELKDSPASHQKKTEFINSLFSSLRIDK